MNRFAIMAIVFSLSLFIFLQQEYFTIIEAEEIITIILDSSDEKREVLWHDITYYPIKPGKNVKWSNADNIPII